MSKLNDKINVILFGGIMVFGLESTLLIPDKEFSEIENRTLAQKPAFTLENFFSGNLDDETEEYLSDQFILRDSCVTLKSSTDALIGKKEFNGCYLADGRLLERMDEPTEQFNTNITAVNNAANALNIPLSLALVPTATDVYKDTLPTGAPTANQQKLLSSISQNLNNDIDMINMSAIMYEHKDEYIYYRTDHHWTSLGAYYGAKALLNSMGYEIAPPEDFNIQTVTEDFNGTLYSSSGVRSVTPDSIDIYVEQGNTEVESWRNGSPEQGTLYDFSYLDKKDKYSMFLGGNQPLAILRTGNEGGKLLLVRDSYADSLVPFLMPYFSEIHLFDARYFKQPLSSYVNSQNIDHVVMLFSLKNFLTDTNLTMVCK